MHASWPELAAETVEHLQRLIQFESVNPPGNERPVAEYLRDALVAEGIATELIETAPNRACVYARIPGNGRKQPIMLLAHSDVVEVEPQKWSRDPFGGEIHEGYVYGRGAIDDKGMLAVNLVTMLQVQRDRKAGAAVWDRDLVLLVTADEEAGGTFGMEWLVQNRPDVLEAEYVVNEGGRIRRAADGSMQMLLQTAEKISHLVVMTARGGAGHAGVPRPDNAILTLGKALAAIAPYASDPLNGLSPTVLKGGSKFNVIPGEASVLMNIRLRPGEDTIDTVVARLTQLIGDPAVTLAIEERGTEAPASPVDSPMYAAIVESLHAIEPGTPVTPYTSNGITDSARLRARGVKCYGILPFPLLADDESRMHGHDERVPTGALEFGVRLIYGAVSRMA